MTILNNGPAWAPIGVPQNLRDRIIRLSDELGAAPEQNLDGLFRQLCNYSRVQFQYTPRGVGMGEALDLRAFSCETIAELLRLLWGYRNRGGVPQNARNLGILHGNTPVLSPRVMNPGIRIQPNVRNGNGRLFFNSGHFVAEIGGFSYDVIAAISGPNLDNQYLACNPVMGNPRDFTCRIHERIHTLKRIGQTANGLGEFVAEPPL